jgi:hypothetical protein
VTAPAAAPGFEVPDYVEPIEAWRAWRVVAHAGGFALASVVKPTVWPAGEPLVAECLRGAPLGTWLRRRRRPAPPVPDPPCECGIYAAGLDVVGSYLNEALPPAAVARAIGRVALWGTVIECERGYRASHAYPRLVYLPVDSYLHGRYSWDEVIAGLGVYGVRVEPLAARCADATRVLERAQLTLLQQSDR